MLRFYAFFMYSSLNDEFIQKEFLLSSTIILS